MASSSGAMDVETAIPTLKLNDGNHIPMLAYGTGTAWSKRNGPEDQVDFALVNSILDAIKLGYRHFDCAESYRNEVDLGAAIQQSGIPRSEFYITTKVLNGIDDIPGALKKSLKKLRLEYVDLYLIHSPYFANDPPGDEEGKLQRAWADMEGLQTAGLARSIGVSNFLPEHLKTIHATAIVTPAINQLELHPYLQRRKVREAQLADAPREIATAAYGPLSPVTRASPGPLDDTLAGLAKKYGVSPGDICLRWAVQQGIVVVTTSSKVSRLSEYLRVGKFRMTPEEVEEISRIGEKKHFRGFWGRKFDENDRT